MIRFEELEGKAAPLHDQFVANHPFPHLVIDEFADSGRLRAAASAIPAPDTGQINKSRDYFFAKNKFEKADFCEFSPELAELYDDLVSDRFQSLLRAITGEHVFVDKDFFGGGIHQGGQDSYLDLHVDFNYHPEHTNWFRNLNILLYLNLDWKPEFRGQLKLRHSQTGEATEVDPVFNRCVIMFTRGYTLHGYDRISFPPNTYRRSIATYAYTLHEAGRESFRSTVWMPESGSKLKKIIGAHWPQLVKIKNLLFGIGTKKNR